MIGWIDTRTGRAEFPETDGSRHIDVDVKLFNRSHQLATLIGVKRARIGAVDLVDGGFEKFEDVTLEPGGPREESSFTLSTRDGSALVLNDGATVKIEFRLTRGGSLFGTPSARLVVSED